MSSPASQLRGPAASPSALTCWRAALRRDEQLLQRMLRMGGAHRRPARLVHVLVEAGENDGTVGKACDGLQQRAGGGDRARGARRDEGLLRAGEFEALRLAPQDGGAPRLGADRLLGHQALGIFLPRDGEELENGLAVAGGFEAIELREFGQVDVLGLDGIEEFGQRRGKPTHLLGRGGDLLGEPCCRMGAGPFVDQFHQQQKLAGCRDGCSEVIGALRPAPAGPRRCRRWA